MAVVNRPLKLPMREKKIKQEVPQSFNSVCIETFS